MPADGAFGLVEQKLRKIDIILDPKEYDAVLNEVGTLHNTANIQIRTWVESTKQILKTGDKGFKISDAKSLKYTFTNPEFICFNNMSKHKITKNKYKNLNKISLNLKTVNKSSKISEEKSNDVKHLLHVMGIDWQKDKFFSTVLTINKRNVLDDENIAYYHEDEDC